MNLSHPDHDHRCRDFLERLSRYLDDDLPAAQRRIIQQHLADCPCCEDVLESLKDTVRLCQDKGRPHLPREVRARARKRVSALLKEMEGHEM